MDVLIYVNYQGKEYCWDDLSKSQQKEFTEKLNQQTANQLGYVKSNQEEKMIKADGAEVIIKGTPEKIMAETVLILKSV